MGAHAAAKGTHSLLDATRGRNSGESNWATERQVRAIGPLPFSERQVRAIGQGRYEGSQEDRRSEMNKVRGAWPCSRRRSAGSCGPTTPTLCVELRRGEAGWLEIDP